MAKNSNNIQGVLFLRNGSLYTGRTEARQEIVANQGLVGDGEFILARYLDGNSHVQTLVGVKYHGTAGDFLTIIDMEGASADVEKLREEINAKLGNGITSANTATAQLETLSGTSSDASGVTSVWGAKAYADAKIGELDYADEAVTGSYVSKVDQADGKIAVTRVALPTVAAISETGKPITAVSESLGEISATAGTINAEFVNIADSGEKFSATTVEAALAELDDKIADVVDGLDYTDTAVTGNYVSKVDEVNGVISVTREPLPSKTDTAVAKNFVKSVSESLGEITVERGSISSSAQTIVLTDNADGGVNFEVNIDNDTIVQDETTKKLKVSSAALTQYIGDEDTIHVSAVDANNEKTISSLLTISATTPTETNVKEQYNLVGASGNTIGATIKIYKDSSLYSVYLGHVDDTLSDDEDPTSIVSGTGSEALCFIYHKEDGTYELVAVDVESFLMESEFASGVTADSTTHIVHGVVDPTSELDSNDVAFLTVGADGFKISGIKDEIAAQLGDVVEDLDATVTGATSGNHITISIEELDGKLVQSGLTIEENDIASAAALAQEIADREQGDEDLDERLGTGVTAENTATAQLAALSGTNESLSGETSVEGAKRYADAKLADVVAGLDAVVSGESTHVNVEVSEENGVITAVTVVEDNIADADDLTELSGKTITAITSTNGSISASINDAVGNKTADIETDASKIKMSGFTSTDALSGITSSSSITEAFKEVDAVITEDERVTAAALNDLDERLDEIESGYVGTIKVNDVALTETDHAVNVQISGATSAMTGNNAVIVETDDTTGAITIGLGYIDCGTY